MMMRAGIWPGGGGLRTIVNTAAILTARNPSLAAWQMAVESDTGMRKFGPGQYNSLSYMPRRWSAIATNILPATSGDGVEKTLADIVIPANTLRLDGDVIRIGVRGLYLNNTGSNQTPQWGIALNARDDWFLSSSSGQSTTFGVGQVEVFFDFICVRTSASTITIDPVLSMSNQPAWWVNSFGVGSNGFGTWNWNGTQRRAAGVGVVFDCAELNVLHIKTKLSAYVTPELHQVAGNSGYAILHG